VASPRKAGAATAAALLAALALACGGSDAGPAEPTVAPTAASPASSTPGAERSTAVARDRDASSDSAAPALGVEEASRVEDGARLILTVDGADEGIDNGGRAVIAPSLAIELFLDPFPPNTLSSVLDVYVEQDGKPAEDGAVFVQYDMLAMAHGPFDGTGTSIGGGHYLLPLEYIMFGPWDQILTIRAGDQRVRLPLVIIARP
jgi:hypothetical protein